jgi:aspartyl-tRNA(Asn)/glutamyl-tRNA(Gln) amidotransferase subunit A
MGRSAEDCAILFDAIAQYDPRDPNSVASPLIRHTSTLIEGAEGRDPLSLQGLKFGVPQDAFVAPLDAEVRKVWQAALYVFEEEGVELVDVELPRPTMELYRMVQRPEATLSHIQKGWFPTFQNLYTDNVRERLIQGQQITAIDYLEAQQERRNFASSLRAIMQRVDAFVLPTLPIPAIPAELADQTIEVDGVTEQAQTAFLRLTMPFNLAGLPAISFPCGFSSDGLPLGLQVAGKPFEDATVLRIAHAYQQLTDWHRREIPLAHR